MKSEITRDTRPIAPPRPPQPERVKVLVMLHSDAWVEVYADKRVDVRIVQRLYVEDDASVNLVDEHLERSLPEVYRRLYWPVKLRAAALVRRVTPETALSTLIDLDIIEALRQFREGRR
jgi:hypothetical protein